MSDANLPPHNPEPSDVTDTPQTNWFVGWDDFASEEDEPLSAPNLDDTLAPDGAFVEASVQVSDEAPVEATDAITAEVDEPALHAQAEPIAEPAVPAWVEHATPRSSIDLPAWHEAATTAATTEDIPDIADLISLIQELNQCNNALLDRVSQLEDALEQANQLQSQPSLMALMGDTEQAAQLQKMAQDLDATRSHASQLFEQLDAAHQSSKRQQILAETLSEQLQNSQERVAQLERECALTQQKYNEQTQLLTQSEAARRDLTARLQRQQRYTLQFKAALEKCLEVSPSSLATILEAIEAQPVGQDMEHGATTGLPKAQRIRPWSSQSDSQFLGKMSDIIGHGDREVDGNDVEPLFSETDADAMQLAAPEDEPGKLQPPVLQLPTGLNESVTVTNALASANTANQSRKSDRSLELPITTTAQTELGLPADVIKAGVEELQAALSDLWGGQPHTELPQDAEATLWEDLARLIDVSSDDLIKAVTTDDYSHTESDFDLESLTTASTQEAASSGAAIVPLSDTPSQVVLSKQSDRSPGEKPAPFLANPSWPSPLVHPLRRPRKLPSLAAVELPRFAN